MAELLTYDLYFNKVIFLKYTQGLNFQNQGLCLQF